MKTSLHGNIGLSEKKTFPKNSVNTNVKRTWGYA